MASKANKKKTAKAAAKSAKPLKKKAAKAPAKKAVANKTVKKAVAKSAAKKTTKPAVKAKSAAAKAKPSKTTISNWTNFLTPLDDRLIVEMKAAERVTAGGLYIPDTVTDTSGNYQGKVIIVGRGHRDKFGKVTPMDVKAGDLIVFAQFSGSNMELNGKEIRILRESEVLGIVGK